MCDMSFTDEQLLNLVNNTVKTKTEFELKDFTGGGVQITSTYNHRVIKYKIYLTFGYDEKRNSRSYQEDIDEQISFIWQKAIALKVKSMQSLNTGSSLSELNKLMNTDSKIEIVDNKDSDIDKECNDIVPTSLRNKKTDDISYILPNGVDKELFNDFLALRKKLKAPNTPRAINGLINKINDFISKGFNPNEIIQTSYENGWKSLFEPKNTRSKTDNNINVAKDWLEEQSVFDTEVIGE